jgi:hypothetical protein
MDTRGRWLFPIEHHPEEHKVSANCDVHTVPDVGLSVLVDLGRLDPRFRVVAFLFLRLMALLLSLSYSRIKRMIGKGAG